MATKVAVEKTKAQNVSLDGPLLDALNAEVKKMMARGRERGYVTYDELNTALPPDQVSSEQIEDTMSMLSEVGINVVENEETEDTNTETGEKEQENISGNIDENDVGRSDDPVRMYLREMGSVELLSREGEIAIAKRIEAGREMMIGGIVDSPMTIRALLQWRDALDEGLMLLRDIIDLDATYSGPKEDNTIPNVGEIEVPVGEISPDRQQPPTKQTSAEETKSETSANNDVDPSEEDDDDVSSIASIMSFYQ